jgi:hypothetical protein
MLGKIPKLNSFAVAKSRERQGRFLAFLLSIMGLVACVSGSASPTATAVQTKPLASSTHPPMPTSTITETSMPTTMITSPPTSTLPSSDASNERDDYHPDEIGTAEPSNTAETCTSQIEASEKTTMPPSTEDDPFLLFAREDDLWRVDDQGQNSVQITIPSPKIA